MNYSYDNGKFVKRLQELIKEKGLNNFRLSVESGIPRTTIVNWLNRCTVPNINALCVLADYFKCSVDFLIGREEY